MIIEGQDRIGKSSLVKNLCDRNSFSEMHFSKPIGKTDREKAHFQMGTFDRFFSFCKAIDGQEVRVVCDRAHLGEMVYGPLYRPNSGIDPEYVIGLEKKYGHIDDIKLILLVNQDFETVSARDDGLGFGMDRWEEEKDLFLEAFKKSSIGDKTVIDVTGLTIEEVYEISIKFLNLNQNLKV